MPELTSFSSPFIEYAAFLPKCLTLPAESITTAFEAIAFDPKIKVVDGLLRFGIITGSLVKLTIGIKLDEFLTSNVALSSGRVLLSRANVRVCGSGATGGLYHIML